MFIDYHIHVLAHGEFEYSPQWIAEYLNQARSRGIVEVGFSEHDWYYDKIDIPSIISASRNDMQGPVVRIGLEVDYLPERETEIAAMVRAKGFDYVIGSVHHINGWPFDHPDHKAEFEKRDIDEVYESYYELVGRALLSGAFDVLGHLDLVKVWGHRPLKRSQADFIRPLLRIIRDSGIVLEINSAGMRKPVGEMYPSQILVDELFAADIPITIGSDAHRPEDVGEGLTEVITSAWQAGYRYVTCFEKHKKIPVLIVK
ncbi:MAG: histidinol-phosphatase HisJ family protein [Candidatus Saccharibacteria bacterium]